MLTKLTKLSSLQGDIVSGRLDRDRTFKVYFTISPTFCSVNFVLLLFVKISAAVSEAIFVVHVALLAFNVSAFLHSQMSFL
jgi:hypothetical protein